MSQWRVGAQEASADEPCGACANCQSNQRDREVVRLHGQAGAGVEVLGSERPCTRQQEAIRRFGKREEMLA